MHPAERMKKFVTGKGIPHLKSLVEKTITTVEPIPEARVQAKKSGEHTPQPGSEPLLHHAMLGTLAQTGSTNIRPFGRIQHDERQRPSPPANLEKLRLRKEKEEKLMEILRDFRTQD